MMEDREVRGKPGQIKKKNGKKERKQKTMKENEGSKTKEKIEKRKEQGRSVIRGDVTSDVKGRDRMKELVCRIGKV